MSARNEILSGLGRREVAVLKPRPRVRNFSDLPNQFATALAASKGVTTLAASREEALKVLQEKIEVLQIERIVAHREEPLAALGLPDALPDQRWFFAGEVEDYRAQCAAADLGLTSAEAAFAETGSLVIVSSPTQSRMTSLLPPIHIVLLPESRIMPSIFEWSRAKPDPMPANLILVSGPSKTADIEQTLVVGVHGPKILIVIIYPE